MVEEQKENPKEKLEWKKRDQSKIERKKRDKGTLFIGNARREKDEPREEYQKKASKYMFNLIDEAVARLSQQDELNLKARGNAISNAVKVALITISRFEFEEIIIKEKPMNELFFEEVPIIKKEDNTEEEGKPQSAINITLARKK